MDTNTNGTGRDASKRVIKEKFDIKLTKAQALKLFAHYLPDNILVKAGINDEKGTLAVYTDGDYTSLGQWPMTFYPNQWRTRVGSVAAALYQCAVDEASSNARLSYSKETVNPTTQGNATIADDATLDAMLNNL